MPQTHTPRTYPTQWCVCTCTYAMPENQTLQESRQLLFVHRGADRGVSAWANILHVYTHTLVHCGVWPHAVIIQTHTHTHTSHINRRWPEQHTALVYHSYWSPASVSQSSASLSSELCDLCLLFSSNLVKRLKGLHLPEATICNLEKPSSDWATFSPVWMHFIPISKLQFALKYKLPLNKTKQCKN